MWKPPEPIRHPRAIHHEWRWYYCRDGHAKMLSEKRPACPECHWAMNLPDEPAPAAVTETVTP